MLVIVTMRRLDRALQQLWKNVKDAILGVQEIVHPSEKEIVNAISIASIDDVEAPQEGAFYMIEPSDGVDGFLFLYQNGAFNEVIPEEGIIYIVNSPDKSHIYIYNAPLWEDVTGQPVDNTLYITNTTTDLESYTDKGMYSVCLSLPLRNTEWYTFTISVNRGRHMVGRPATNTYIQTLINNDCWKRRTKIGGDSWSDWTEYRYAYTEDLTSKQDKSDSSLQTTAKTVVGAINEVDTKTNNIEKELGNEDMSAEHAQSIKGAIAEINYWKGNASQDIEHAIGDIKELQSAVNSKQPLGDYAFKEDLASKQDKLDLSLQTTEKTVPGAINELKILIERHLVEYAALGDSFLLVESKVGTLSLELPKLQERVLSIENDLYRGQFVKNNDGENTFTWISPITSYIEQDEDGCNVLVLSQMDLEKNDDGSYTLVI